MNSKEFSLIIERTAREKRLKYIDAIIWYCEENDIDTAGVGKLITKGLKDKISLEAQDLNLLKEKTAKLPL
jgi:hypothetical protein